MKIILYIIAIISIDIFYLLYKLYKKLELKRINLSEMKNEIDEEDLTKIEDIKSKIPIVIYTLSVIIIGFYINFINDSSYVGTNFISNLKIEFSLILLPLLFYFTLNVFFKYIKTIFSFLSGVKEGMRLDNSSDEENEDDEDDEDEEYEDDEDDEETEEEYSDEE